MRIEAAIIGQKAIRELTGRPGKSCTEVKAPISQSGIERVKTNKKNFRGDLPSDFIRDSLSCCLMVPIHRHLASKYRLDAFEPKK